MNLGSRNTIVPLVRMGCLFLVLGALEIQRVLLERNTLTMMWSWVATPVLTLAIVLAFLVLRERDEEESRDSVGRDRTPLWVWVAAVFCFVALFAPLAHDLSKRLWRIPVTPYQADMLPLIREGLRTFFRDGTNPYRSYLVGNWELPLTYPPALWLSFAPAYLAGMDIRYGTLFFYLLVGFVMLAHSLPGRPSSRRIVFARQTAIFLGTLLFLRLLITLRIMEHMNPVIQVVPYWAYLGLWAWAFCSKRWIFSSILLAWFLLCRPPAIVIVPFWFLFLWRNRREVPWARMIAIAAATGVAVGAAFLVQSPSVFFKDVPAYYRLVATLGMEAENPTHLFIGWARTFYLLGIHEYVTEAGLLLVGGLCVWAWFGLR
ncbi:hypothetical protein JW916_14665, partial [Candidatus Sumerlaeota bacterium]|nr:hypothetical protein [Candidatus Sumerlaeota bacterium]